MGGWQRTTFAAIAHDYDFVANTEISGAKIYQPILSPALSSPLVLVKRGS